MTPPRVCLFAGSLNIGGTERNILHVARQLKAGGWPVEVWCNYEGQPLQAELEAAGVPCRGLKRLSTGRPFLSRVFLHNLPYQFRLWRLLRQRRRDIIHGFGFPMTYYVILLGWLAGARRMVFAVQDWDVWKKGRLYRWLDRLCSAAASRIIADGQGAARLAVERQGMSSAKMGVLYDGVDTAELTPKRDAQAVRAELGAGAGEIVATVIARLDARKKGQDVFLAAARYVTTPVRFVLVGGGPDQARLEDMAAGLPPVARPVFAGFRSDLADVIQASDIIVIPSRWESVPKILLEAMWLRRPVIASRAGDIAEILDNTAGRLTPVDDPYALAAAITELAADPALRAKLGQAGRDIIERRRLTLDASIARLKEQYLALASS